ncbi:MAG: type II toxin-antitoxin system HipA family toxin [Bradymonadia bacterium]
MTEARAVTVRLYGSPVGHLEALGDAAETYRFEFAPEWLSRPDRPVLGQQFEDRQPGPLIFTNGGLPLWFRGLLPQGRLLRMLSRRWGLDPDDHLDLLIALGADLPGAVTINQTSRRHSATDISPAPTSHPADATDLQLSFSLTGAQWKLSVKPGERGLIVPVRGESGDWIAKLHDPEYPGLPHVEFNTACWARAAGVHTPMFRMGHVDEFAHPLPVEIPTGDGHLFLSRRFDRNPVCHMEDFAQILDRPDQQRGISEDVAAILALICPEDLRAFVERLVFCVLSGNGDAHLKNWSLTYPDRLNGRLSPAYDLVSTVLFLPNDNLTLPIGGHRAFDHIDHHAFEPLARVTRHDFAEIGQWVREAAQRVRAAWLAEGGFDFTASQKKSLEAHMARVPLVG